MKCQFERDHCLKCRDDLSANFDYDDKILALKDNRCVFVNKTGECPTSTYFDFDKSQCELCDIGCLECSGWGEASCLRCDERRPYLQEGRCVSECERGFYLESSVNKCVRCGPDCDECQLNENKCRTCEPGFVLVPGNICRDRVFYGLFHFQCAFKFLRPS